MSVEILGMVVGAGCAFLGVLVGYWTANRERARD